jgi:hypothetical protein
LSKKKTSISLYTLEAKYIAAAACCTQVLWMKQTLKDIKVEYDQPISIICDKICVINISKNLVVHSKMKDIPIKYHFLREKVALKSVKLEYIFTKEQVPYVSTKPLPRDTFEYIILKLGVISLSSCQ